MDQSSAFPRYIRGDEARLRQILVNLVSNAVNFTEHGGVTIRLGLRRSNRRRLLIEVEDSGIGIASEDQKRLFQPFVQLAESGEQKGTGLGLVITRQFVELMGGSIALESCPGKGSIFRVELPVEPMAEADIAIKPAATGAGDVCGLVPGQPDFRILIAEDQRENQLLLMKLMTDIGLSARLAEDGEQCVNVFQEWRPQLIWMDRRMPVMDGVEATRRIRQLPGGREVKIVAVTASVFQEERQNLAEAGMDDFVRKPYRIGEIYDCLARHLGVKYLYRSARPGVEAGAPAMEMPDRLTALPAPLRVELKAAIEENLDCARIAAAIAEAGKTDAVLARALTRFAENFDYPAILRALAAKRVRSSHSRTSAAPRVEYPLLLKGKS